MFTMDDTAPVQNYELNDGGVCTSCNELSLELVLVQCGICKKKFHAVCTSSSGDDKWATKSMILTFKASSTKKNFMFLCDCRLTTLETNMADIDGQRIRKMERNMDVISKELLEIKKLVRNTNTTSTTSKNVESTWKNPQQTALKLTEPSYNMWNDTAKLASVKAKPAESVLVINKATDSSVDKINTDLVENMVIENRIPVTKSFKNRNGNLVVVCDSVESRDALKNQVSASNDNIEMKTPKENRPVVSIVGLTKKYEKHEVTDLLVKQNYFLGQFAEQNNVDEHIDVFMVKPLRGKRDVYQAFARVSKIVRQGFKTYNDKVTMGLSTCKVYDQYHVKRCNNCQAFGHFYKNCPSSTAQVCANCAENHSTRDCSSTVSKCINCVKAGIPIIECDHRSDDSGCPCLRKEQEKMKNNLNMRK